MSKQTFDITWSIIRRVKVAPRQEKAIFVDFKKMILRSSQNPTLIFEKMSKNWKFSKSSKIFLKWAKDFIFSVKLRNIIGKCSALRITIIRHIYQDISKFKQGGSKTPLFWPPLGLIKRIDLRRLFDRISSWKTIHLRNYSFD